MLAGRLECHLGAIATSFLARQDDSERRLPIHPSPTVAADVSVEEVTTR